MFKGLWARRRRERLLREAVKVLEAQDTEALTDWITRSPEHLTAYIKALACERALARVLSPRRAHAHRRRSDPAIALRPAKLRHRALVAARSARRHARPPSSTRIRIAALGAALLSCAALSIAVWNFYAPTYSASAQGKRIVRLADGSRVILNSEARVRARLHGRRRELEVLRGEAYFDVARDPNRPFLVAAAGCITQAIGTRFAVRLDDEHVTVTVHQGRVALLVQGETSSFADRITLSAAETGTVTLAGSHRIAEVHHLEQAALRKTLDWTGSVEFEGLLLSELVARFNEANTLQISIDDPRLASIRLSGRVSIIQPEKLVAAVREIRDAVAIGPDSANVLHLALGEPRDGSP